MDSDDEFNHFEEEEEEEEMDCDDDCSNTGSKTYTLLTEADIRHHQEDAIAEVCTVLSVSRASAIVLLLHHQWSVSKLHEAWFANQDRVRKAVGLLESPPAKTPKNKELVNCGICFESYLLPQVTSAGCNHYYCTGCF